MRAPLNVALAGLLLAYAGLVAAGTPAQADIITSTVGSVSHIAPPSPPGGVLDEDEQTGSVVFVWQEQAISPISGGDVTVDHDGSTGAFATVASLTGDTLFTNSAAYSYYFLFDFDNTTGTGLAAGSVTFSEEIIGIVLVNSNLEASDTEFENPDISTVGSGNWTNRDWNIDRDAADLFSISLNRMTLTFAVSGAGGSTDHMRILLNPEPSTWALFALGGLGMAGIARRRRRLRAAHGA